MIDAFIICDMGNPLSMRYVELSLKSFEPVSDILRITPVQCTTPDTLPIRFQKNEEPIPFYVGLDYEDDYLRPRFFGGTFCDQPIYNSIMHSQLMLIEKIAAGQPIAIMEHDAALVNEESFRTMIDEYWGEVDIFMPGTCMEFYGLSQRYAEKFVDFMYNFPYLDSRVSGPLGSMLAIEQLNDLNPFDDYEVLAPTKSREDIDMQSFAPNLYLATHGQGYDMYQPACKQFFFRNAGNTNAMKYDLAKPIFESMQEQTASGKVANLNATGPTWSRDFVILED